jgi:exopolyphosphatase/guanosine-5'-triphosphate,3'-diphosphate pyrophosphatase
VGKGYNPLQMDSLYIGCVSLTRRYFDDGRITSVRFRKAERVVQRELEPVSALYRRLGWDEVVGTSGTIKAIDQLSRSLGLEQDWIAFQNVDDMKSWMIEAGHVENLDYISEQRRPVFPGGFAILATIFKEFEIERMDISEGALREGVAYDLLGRLHDEDSRFRGVDSLVERFQPDPAQSERIQKLATHFFQQIQKKWNLNRAIDRKLLIWASSLHEIGFSIAYSQNQLHSGYIIENSNMDGFSRQVQRILALLVRNHRQKINRDQIDSLPGDWSNRVLHLLVLLRLAVAFYRGRSDADLSFIQLKPRNHRITVKIPEDWADDHPLTIFDLETEQSYLSSVGFKMRLKFV